MRQDAFPRYPEIVLTRYCPEIFSVKEVVATEKLHGSNLRVHFPCGMTSIQDIRFGSREVEYIKGEPFPLGVALRHFEERSDLLAKMWEVIKSYGFSEATVFGEAYGPGIKTKGIKYSDGQSMLFRSFDIMVGKNFLTYDLFCEVADKMGVPRVHEVWRGPPSLEAFDALLEKPSTEAVLNGITDEKNVAEGVVIRSNPLLRTVFGDWLIVKHKAKKFAEVTPSAEPKGPRALTPLDDLATRYVTEGRVQNAVLRLHDRGTPLNGNMQDMPRLLTEVVADLEKEVPQEEWLAVGFPASKALQGAVSRVLGPIYRKSLADIF